MDILAFKLDFACFLTSNTNFFTNNFDCMIGNVQLRSLRRKVFRNIVPKKVFDYSMINLL